MGIKWLSSEQTGAQDFRIESDKRPITGALWLPESITDQTPLVLCGHGASGDRYQKPIPHLARRCTLEAGCAVIALDGPVHGLRQVGPGGREALAVEMNRPTSIDEMVADWLVAFSEIRRAHGLNGPTGYFGLSMGTIFGLPLLAHGGIDFAASAIGLAGSTRAGRSFGERLLADAARVSHPVAFLMQLEDELFDRDGYLALFDALASTDKRLHANPGLHPEVPAEEIAFVFEFLMSRLNGGGERRIVNPLAE